MGNFIKEHLNPMRSIDLAKAPFEDHGDQPWLQGTVRNMAQAIEGPTIANYNMQHILGDTMVDGQGYRNPPPQMAYDFRGQNQGMAMGAPPKVDTSIQPVGGDDMQYKMLQQFMQGKRI